MVSIRYNTDMGHFKAYTSLFLLILAGGLFCGCTFAPTQTATAQHTHTVTKSTLTGIQEVVTSTTKPLPTKPNTPVPQPQLPTSTPTHAPTATEDLAALLQNQQIELQAYGNYGGTGYLIFSRPEIEGEYYVMIHGEKTDCLPALLGDGYLPQVVEIEENFDVLLCRPDGIYFSAGEWNVSLYSGEIIISEEYTFSLTSLQPTEYSVLVGDSGNDDCHPLTWISSEPAPRPDWCPPPADWDGVKKCDDCGYCTVMGDCGGDGEE